LIRKLGLQALHREGKEVGVQVSQVTTNLQSVQETNESTQETDKSDTNSVKKDDVLLAIDNRPIRGDGSVVFSDDRDERIDFAGLLSCKCVESKVELEVFRDGKQKTLKVQLGIDRRLVPQIDGYDAFPLYCIVGGCVFSPLTKPLLVSVHVFVCLCS